MCRRDDASTVPPARSECLIKLHSRGAFFRFSSAFFRFGQSRMENAQQVRLVIVSLNKCFHDLIPV
jgi:hypothetical protein